MRNSSSAPVRVVIVGAAGRMGQALVRCAGHMTGVQLAAAVDRPDCPAIGRDAGVVAGIGETSIAITADLQGAAAAGDVIIDFTAHTAVPDSSRIAAALKKGLVAGTTGLTGIEKAALVRAAQDIPVVWAPNMSVGMNLLFAMVERAAGVLGLDYDVEIVEVHHKHKKDAPSGSALRLGEKIAKGRGQDFQKVAVYGREGITGERPVGQIGIHAVRAGDVVGDHAVSFAIDGERIELGHRASSRDCFAMGALRAAIWLNGRKPGLYDMQDVLGL